MKSGSVTVSLRRCFIVVLGMSGSSSPVLNDRKAMGVVKIKTLIAIRALSRRCFCVVANAISKGVSLMFFQYHFAAASISNSFLPGTL